MLKKVFNKFRKEKGFTLVELLAVIAILGIIVAIAVPTVGNVIENSRDDAINANEDLIVNAARLAHVSDLEFSTDGVGASGTKYYTLDDLVDNGFLDKIPGDIGDNSYSGKDTVSVESTDGKNGATFTWDGVTID